MEWTQQQINLRPRSRGFHIITDEVLAALPQLRDCSVGVLHLFIQHTSASLAINEDASPDVRSDLEGHFNILAPEHARHYRHTDEGPDDMPAHIKAVLIGSALTLPIANGKLLLGTWQGIYLCEHRNHGGTRKVVATVMGAMQ